MKYNFDEIIERKGTNSFKHDFLNQIFKRDDLIPMWVADMDFRTPDFIINAIKKRLNHEILGYTFKSDQFNNSVVNWIKKRYNWEIKSEWIQFSPGVVPSIAFCIQAFTKPGDKIIVQPPVYHPFINVIKENNRNVVFNKLINQENKYRINFEELEKSVDEKVKMILLSNPHNPVGRVWNKDELTKLGDFCVKNDIIIISDEIHADIVFKPNKHIPIAGLNNNFLENTVTLYAPSKTFNMAGLASSVIIVQHKKLYKKLEHEIRKLHIGMGNIFGLVGLEVAYSEGEEWLEELLKYLKDNIEYIYKYLMDNIPIINFEIPQATYLLWLNCKGLGLNNNELSNLFINKIKIGLNDGVMFGPGGEGYQRMNIGCPKSVISRALSRIQTKIKA